MTLAILIVALVVAADIVLIATLLLAGVFYYDVVAPAIRRRRSRIWSTDSTTFVEDPFVDRHSDHLRVIGGRGEAHAPGRRNP